MRLASFRSTEGVVYMKGQPESKHAVVRTIRMGFGALCCLGFLGVIVASFIGRPDQDMSWIQMPLSSLATSSLVSASAMNLLDELIDASYAPRYRLPVMNKLFRCCMVLFIVICMLYFIASVAHMFIPFDISLTALPLIIGMIACALALGTLHLVDKVMGWRHAH